MEAFIEGYTVTYGWRQAAGGRYAGHVVYAKANGADRKSRTFTDSTFATAEEAIAAAEAQFRRLMAKGQVDL